MKMFIALATVMLIGPLSQAAVGIQDFAGLYMLSPENQSCNKYLKIVVDGSAFEVSRAMSSSRKNWDDKDNGPDDYGYMLDYKGDADSVLPTYYSRQGDKQVISNTKLENGILKTSAKSFSPYSLFPGKIYSPLTTIDGVMTLSADGQNLHAIIDEKNSKKSRKGGGDGLSYYDNCTYKRIR
ncbi:hypothetical protein [Bdellovibrio sp. HCB337]|uniref:hypothetical protein n=1 Tax=Bdellovibrio sp. HCB337 TaxID=3394358 RepID=UPI0039A4047A